MRSLTFRRHYPLLLALLVVTVVLAIALGDQRIIAYTTPGLLQVEAATSNRYGADVALFDDSVVHSIRVLMSPEDFEQMLATYRETGEKDYFHADVVIDGVRINDVGVRLKGNASLRTAVGGRMAGEIRQLNGRDARPDQGAAPGQLPNLPEGQAPVMPEGQPPMRPDAEGNFPQRGLRPGAQAPGMDLPALPGGGFPGGMGNTEVTVDSKIPLLLRFDKFVDGQTYQGYTRLALRTYGTSTDAAMLQEPVTNAAVRAIGLPATLTAFAGVQLNDGQVQLYTLSQAIDVDYLAAHFSNANGVLYKAELGSTLRYEGEDPTLYTSSFTQKTRVKDADFAPLIAFMQFVTEADDATFAAELSRYLDVESFAAYLAVNNLLVNLDSIVTMGHNYYLYYDDTAQRFTVLMWDANESLGKFAFGGEAAANYNIYYQGQQRMGPQRGGDNLLATRFLATPEFVAVYEAQLQRIYQTLFASGLLLEQAETYAAVVRAANSDGALTDSAAYEQAVAKTLNFITQRQDYLAALPLFSAATSSLAP